MKLTLAELRNYIRNAMSPAVADREQLQFIAQDEIELGGGDEAELEDSLPTRPDDNPLGAVMSDPYVTYDRGASTTPPNFYKMASLQKKEKRPAEFRPRHLKDI